jgi:DNA-binding CsgD family transcriptional regulator
VNIEIALSRTSVADPDYNSNHDAAINDQNTGALELSLLSEALDHLTSGIVVIDDHLQVYFNNKSARTILHDRYPIRITGDTLAFANARMKKTLLEQLDKKSNVIFTVNHKDVELHVLIFPLTNPVHYDLNRHSSSILFLFDTIRDANRIEEVVRTIYKLSPTEAKIASKLVFNPYLTDISASLGITYNTARTHLKRIYQKTGTNKLPALIQKIVTGPAGLLIHSMD